MADKKLAAKREEVERGLFSASRMDSEALLAQLGTDDDGLGPVEADERLEEYGRNIIDAGNENRLLSRIREALINPFNIVLILVAAVTYPNLWSGSVFKQLG